MPRLTLELGGSNNCVVDRSCDIKMTAKNIAAFRFFNCGQTCVSPNTVFVHEEIFDDFV